MPGGFRKLFKLRVFHKTADSKVQSWEEGGHDGSFPSEEKAVPIRAPPKKGHVAVYVGEEMRRYVIPTRYVSMPEFLPVMEMVREVYGYDQAGGLCIPCDVEEFENLLRRMGAPRRK